MYRRIKARFLNYLAACCAFVCGPWTLAKFYTAWEYYQHDDVYRERLFLMGFVKTVQIFMDDKFSRNYCLEQRLIKDPWLKWRIIFLPWTIERPDIFDIAANSGISYEHSEAAP